jgi:hypothetical protein
MVSPSAQWFTLSFLTIITALVIAYDVSVIRAYGPAASISHVVSRLVGRWPTLGAALVFWLGVLVGHVWLPAR